jgi:hypothetical protein
MRSLWRRLFGRETVDQEEHPVRPQPRAATAAWTLLVQLVLRAVRAHRRTPPPRGTQVGEPHTGADAAFGGELRALRDAPVAPELVTDVETELRWAQIWHDFERDLLGQVDEIFDGPLTALKEPLDAETCIRLDSAKWVTGEFSLVPETVGVA